MNLLTALKEWAEALVNRNSSESVEQATKNLHDAFHELFAPVATVAAEAPQPSEPLNASSPTLTETPQVPPEGAPVPSQ